MEGDNALVTGGESVLMAVYGGCSLISMAFFIMGVLGGFPERDLVETFAWATENDVSDVSDSTSFGLTRACTVGDANVCSAYSSCDNSFCEGCYDAGSTALAFNVLGIVLCLMSLGLSLFPGVGTVKLGGVELCTATMFCGIISCSVFSCKCFEHLDRTKREHGPGFILTLVTIFLQAAGIYANWLYTRLAPPAPYEGTSDPGVLSLVKTSNCLAVVFYLIGALGAVTTPRTVEALRWASNGSMNLGLMAKCDSGNCTMYNHCGSQMCCGNAGVASLVFNALGGLFCLLSINTSIQRLVIDTPVLNLLGTGFSAAAVTSGVLSLSVFSCGCYEELDPDKRSFGAGFAVTIVAMFLSTLATWSHWIYRGPGLANTNGIPQGATGSPSGISLESVNAKMPADSV